jgi:predicted dehydrogenase
VLCEKPLAASAADGEAMVAACAAAGVRLGYGSSYRYLGAMTRARALIAQGALGDVALLVETLTGGGGRADQRAIGEDHYPRGGAGGTSMGLVDHGIHMLDCLPWLVDAPVRSIRGRGNRSGEALRPEHAQLELEGGALCQLLYWDGSYDVALPSEGAFSLGGTWDIHGRYAPPGRWQPPGVEIRVFGSQGALRILPYAHHLYLADADGLRAVPVPSPASPLHFAAQLSAFLDAIERGEAPPVGGADGVAALRLLEAIYDDDREPAREPVPH